MPDERGAGNRTPIIIAIVGIAIELITLLLLGAKRIPETFATPLIGLGMLMAFIPLFVLARRARRRR